MRPNKLTTPWLGLEMQKVKANSNTMIPFISSTVSESNTMKANDQAVTNAGPQISQPIPKELPTLHSWLAQNLQMISLVGPPLWVHCPGPKGLGVKTRKQLAAETLQTDTKVTLIVGASCLSRKKHLTLLRFLAFTEMLTWNWRWYDGRKMDEEDGQMMMGRDMQEDKRRKKEMWGKGRGS